MTEPNRDELNRQIQRLIDREMSDDRQLELLRRIDAEAPETWRTVALGYVEADVMRTLFEEEERDFHGAGAIPLSSPDSPDLPVSKSAGSGSRFHTASVAAAAALLGVFLGTGIRAPESEPPDTEPVLVENAEEPSAAIPPSFRAIESLDLALRDRGFEPVLSEAIYRAELPDGRRLLLPVRKLSFQPESFIPTNQ